jgi:hypothetical protein
MSMGDDARGVCRWARSAAFEREDPAFFSDGNRRYSPHETGSPRGLCGADDGRIIQGTIRRQPLDARQEAQAAFLLKQYGWIIRGPKSVSCRHWAGSRS